MIISACGVNAKGKSVCENSGTFLSDFDGFTLYNAYIYYMVDCFLRWCLQVISNHDIYVLTKWNWNVPFTIYVDYMKWECPSLYYTR